MLGDCCPEVYVVDWMRKQAHGVSVHRFDAESTPLEVQPAVKGCLDELCEGIVAHIQQLHPETSAPSPRRIYHDADGSLQGSL